jgi:hypothetical protein
VIAWENSGVITTNNRHGQRRFLEAWHLGQSNRQFDTSLKEHQKAVSTSINGKSISAEHVRHQLTIAMAKDVA